MVAKAKAKKPKEEERLDPFKTKKTSSKGSGSSMPTLEAADKEVRDAVDKFIAAKVAEAKAKKDIVLTSKPIKAYAMQLYAERQMAGIEGNFRIEGHTTNCQFQMTSTGKSRSDDDVAIFTEEFGEDAAKELFTDDNSLKINGDYLEANWNRIIAALMEALTEEDFENLFKERTKKAVDDVLTRAKKFAADASELEQIYSALELTTKLLK